MNAFTLAIISIVITSFIAPTLLLIFKRFLVTQKDTSDRLEKLEKVSIRTNLLLRLLISKAGIDLSIIDDSKNNEV